MKILKAVRWEALKANGNEREFLQKSVYSSALLQKDFHSV